MYLKVGSLPITSNIDKNFKLCKCKLIKDNLLHFKNSICLLLLFIIVTLKEITCLTYYLYKYYIIDEQYKKKIIVIFITNAGN